MQQLSVRVCECVYGNMRMYVGKVYVCLEVWAVLTEIC